MGLQPPLFKLLHSYGPTMVLQQSYVRPTTPGPYEPFQVLCSYGRYALFGPSYDPMALPGTIRPCPAIQRQAYDPVPWWPLRSTLRHHIPVILLAYDPTALPHCYLVPYDCVKAYLPTVLRPYADRRQAWPICANNRDRTTVYLYEFFVTLADYSYSNGRRTDWTNFLRCQSNFRTATDDGQTGRIF